MKIGYLGPDGTFTQQAAIFYSKENEIIPYKTIADVLIAVENDEINSGVVPIENSIEGSVNITLDTLIFDTNLFIQSQLVLPINHNLMIKKNNDKKNITKILSHPQALGQCRNFLRKNFNGIEIVEVSSTAKACKIISETDECFAAIGNSLCMSIYDLDLLFLNIQDNNNNKTSFILVSKENNTEPQKDYKTTLAFSTENKPGELYKMLHIFSLWDINMTKIYSRPMKDVQGEYMFFVDIETNIDEKDIVDAITMIKRKAKFIKILGSYKEIKL